MGNNIKNAKKWFKQSLHDLEMARKNISIEGYDIAAFLAHQSVEKLLKSIIILKKNKLPKTHFIDDLAREINLSEKLIDIINDLTVDYTFSRYPDISNSVPFEEYNEKIADEKVKKAEIIFKKLKKEYSILEN
ncbi:MAG: HEPN domain-containing protein [archaeon]